MRPNRLSERCAMDSSLAFDAGDPLDAMAESFRIQVCDMAIEANKAAIFRDMDTAQQAQALMGGILTGLVGVLFAMSQEAGRYPLMEAIVDFLPHARLNAESILDEVRHV